MIKKTEEKLILFTRCPVPGKVKTRLIPQLGKKAAADLQKIMTGLAVLNARCFSAASGVDIEIRHSGTNKPGMQKWLGKGLHYRKSGIGDIGRRMNNAFEDAFREGYKRVVLIGCDCPLIDKECLSQAFTALRHKDMVIGPAADGGYYLLGLTEHKAELFGQIEWGTDSVFRKTIAIAENKHLKIAQTAELSDIDTAEDLDLCRKMKLFEYNSKETVSVIIATLNEKANIRKTIETASPPALEVIVADAGSSDGTAELARTCGATVFAASCSRAALLNTAALKAKGDILLFLHADTLLPRDYAKAVIRTLKNPHVAAGAFSLDIDGNTAGIRIMEKGANMRSKFFKLPYGDQAIFTTKNLFLKTGGFSHMPIMEDYELVKRLGKTGTIVTLPQKVKTSARRWRKLGTLKTFVINQLMIAGYKTGISPEKLAGLYRNHEISHK